VTLPRRTATLLASALLAAACSRGAALTDPNSAAAPASAVQSQLPAVSRGAHASPAGLRQIHSPLSGRVVRIVAPPGSEVVPGEPLAWISSPTFDEAVARLRAARAEESAARVRAASARAAAVGTPATVTLPEEVAHLAAQKRRVALATELKPIIPSGRVGDDTSLYALRAPERGTVIAASVGQGEAVTAGGPALFTLAVAPPPAKASE